MSSRTTKYLKSLHFLVMCWGEFEGEQWKFCWKEVISENKNTFLITVMRVSLRLMKSVLLIYHTVVMVFHSFLFLPHLVCLSFSFFSVISFFLLFFHLFFFFPFSLYPLFLEQKTRKDSTALMKKRRGQRSMGRKEWRKEKRSLKKGKKKTKMEVKRKEERMG